jgi:hypothetical protein
LTLDRNDALNSAVANERDLGAFFYWAPSKIRELLQCSLKMDTRVQVIMVCLHLSIQWSNSNRTEGNRNLHVVTRVSYPFVIGSQIIEPGIQAYTGKWAFGSEISLV